MADPRQLVADAYAQRRAVVGANVSSIQMARGVLRAAEASQRPVLIQFNRSGLELIGGAELAAQTAQILARDCDARVAIHLDHADTLPELTDAINAGFSSLMIDGSTLPFEQHVNLAREAIALAAWSRLPVEAELGHVAGDEAGVTIGDASWTDPDEAAQFVRATGVDWLAVAVGNTHGGAPVGGLQCDRLQQIRERVDVPLVLHGASGLDQGELVAAVELGVAKINVGTALHQSAATAMYKSLQERPHDLRRALLASESAVEDTTSALLTAPWAIDS